MHCCSLLSPVDDLGLSLWPCLLIRVLFGSELHHPTVDVVVHCLCCLLETVQVVHRVRCLDLPLELLHLLELWHRWKLLHRRHGGHPSLRHILHLILSNLLLTSAVCTLNRQLVLALLISRVWRRRLVYVHD